MIHFHRENNIPLKSYLYEFPTALCTSLPVGTSGDAICLSLNSENMLAEISAGAVELRGIANFTGLSEFKGMYLVDSLDTY